jgi:hypothetical protein
VHLFLLTDPFRGCAWTAESSEGWILLDAPQARQMRFGDSDVYFTIPANTGSQSRHGTITVDLRQLTIVQNGR